MSNNADTLGGLPGHAVFHEVADSTEEPACRNGETVEDTFHTVIPLACDKNNNNNKEETLDISTHCAHIAKTDTHANDVDMCDKISSDSEKHDAHLPDREGVMKNSDDDQRGHLDNEEISGCNVVEHQQDCAVQNKDTNPTVDHSYSKIHIETTLTHGEGRNESENVLQLASNDCSSACGLLEQDFESGHLNGGFVSSLIEVIDDVEENRDVGCDEDSSSDDSASDSSDSSTDSTSSDSSFERLRRQDIVLAEEVAALKNPVPLKVQGEVLPSDLPPVEELNISLPGDTIFEPIGKVAHIVSGNSVIIQSYLNKPALDSNTVLFFTKQLALGRVEETFGPVPSPYYVVRFNNKEHIHEKGVEMEREVFYAPQITDFTSFVFLSALKKIRGSDASWINDVEPPPACIDYSDDEQEREARKQRKNRNHSDSSSGTSGGGDAQRSRGRGRGRGSRRNNWENRSVRVNVTGGFEECQNGWTNAVGQLPRNRAGPPPPPVPPPMQNNVHHPADSPHTLIDCFRVPPPSFAASTPPPPLFGYQGPFYGQPHGPRQPPANWPMSRFPQNAPMYNFGAPPPPPPPSSAPPP